MVKQYAIMYIFLVRLRIADLGSAYVADQNHFIYHIASL